METRAQVIRRWKRGLLLIAALFVLGFAGAIGWFIHKVEVHRRWYHRVEYLILQLAPKRPADVTPEQWAMCLLHTWNLHTNYGGLEYFPEEAREPFAAEFERHLQEPVTLKTIDQIWDDYTRFAPRSKGYMRYLPTTPSMLEEAEILVQNGGDYLLDEWLNRLERRKREEE
jgi:hypothetical protein